ncbi:MAG TPA: T9SS type A sorting domain-containing protein [Fulvivirga sp.]|nr:T9SS type A sorting domain-containing protein [Fulvivirga sp.]
MKNLTHTLLILILLGAFVFQAKAQQPEILSDINSSPLESDPRGLRVIDGKIYFASGIYNRGHQLSIYDGNTTENILFREGDKGTSSYPRDFVQLGSDIYFLSGTDEFGSEVYKYDGTEVSVIDINPGTTNSNPTELIAFNSKIYTKATDGINGVELWEIDGVTSTMIEIQLGAGSSNPTNLIVYNDELIFGADDGTNGYELWRYDGSTASMIDDIVPGSGHSNPAYFTIYNDKLYMEAAENEVWVYDGSTVAKLTDIIGQTVGTYPRFFTEYNGALYFSGYQASTGSELWKFDGTDADMVANINAGSASGNPRYLAVGAGNLFFDGETANGRELWKFDGTTATEYDLNTGAPDSYPTDFTEVGDKIYFRATTDNDGQELWMHDGTSATLIDINIGAANSTPNYLLSYNGLLYFNANEGDGKFLYTHDGTDLNRILTNTNTSGSYPYEAVVFNDKLYFDAETEETGRELYSYDGSTLNLNDIWEGHETGFSEDLFTDGDKLYYTASDGINGYEMYVNDGSSTTLVDIVPGLESSFPSRYISYNGEIYFRATDGINGFELWKYDGTTATMVQDINPTGNSAPIEFTVANSKLYFVANDGTNGSELWQYDGTSAIMVENISVAGGSNPRQLFAYNSELYFRATSDDDGSDLWKYDGTTLTHFDINPGTGSSSPSSFIEYNDVLYFVANDGTNGRELWKYDGETLTLIDINSNGSSGPFDFTISNGLLYFGAGNEDGSELRSYDGANLNLVIDYSDDEDSELYSIFSFGPMLYLNYYDSSDGTEKLYSYNGTDLTYLEQLYIEGFEGSDDYKTIEYDNYMYFPAASEEYGDTEMWRIRRTSEEADILTFTLPEQISDATIDAVNHTVVIETVFGTDLTSLMPSITVSDYATINPMSGITVDFSSPVVFTVTSEFGNTQDWTISISVEINDAPTDITLSTNSIDENNGVSDVIGLLTSTDPNASDSHTYTLVAGTGDSDNASFDISGDNLIAKEVFDFESKSSYSIRVETNDGRGGTFEKEFIIAINDVTNLTQTINVTPIADKLSTDPAFEVEATVDTGLDLTYTVAGPATNEGATITLDGSVGTVTITVTQAGNGDYASAEVQVSFEVTEGRTTQTITFNPIENQFLETGSLILAATASSGLAVSFEIVSGPATINENTISFSDLGTVVVRASQAGNSEFQAAISVDQTFEVITVTGVEGATMKMSIYPNPASDVITIQTQEADLQVILLNTHGQAVMAIRPNVVNSISHLKQGIYYLRILNEEGSTTHKIIKN